MLRTNQQEPPEEFHPEEFEWFEVLKTLLTDFEPADRISADTWWRTDEIVQALSNHIGTKFSDIDRKNVFECMSYLEYDYASNGELSLEWMLKKRTS